MDRGAFIDGYNRGRSEARQQGRDHVDDLRSAVEIMATKVTPYGEREDGTTTAYIVGDSTWHRVLAVARGSTSDAARAAIDDHEARQQGRDREAAWTAPKGSTLTDAEQRDVRRALASADGPPEPGIDVERLRILWHPGEQPPFVPGRTYRCVAIQGYASGVVGEPDRWTADFDVWEAPAAGPGGQR